MRGKFCEYRLKTRRDTTTVRGQVLDFIDYMCDIGFDEVCDCNKNDCNYCINRDLCEIMNTMQKEAIKIDSKLNNNYLKVD